MSQDVTVVDVAAIINRVKVAYSYTTDIQVAKRLGMSPNAGGISKAIRTNSINLQRVVERCPDLNQDWLIWGRGPMRPKGGEGDMATPIAIENLNPDELAQFITLYLSGKITVPKTQDGDPLRPS